MGAIVHVVRCFEDNDVVHVDGRVDPESDIETISIELAFADLETVQKRQENLVRLKKSNDKKMSEKAKATVPVLTLLIQALEEGIPARRVALDRATKGHRTLNRRCFLFKPCRNLWVKDRT